MERVHSYNPGARRGHLICRAHYATPLMYYVSHCAVNRSTVGVFNADLKLSVLSSGSRRNSGNELLSRQSTAILLQFFWTFGGKTPGVRVPIRGLPRGLATLSKGNREPLAVKENTG